MKKNAFILILLLVIISCDKQLLLNIHNETKSVTLLDSAVTNIKPPHDGEWKVVTVYYAHPDTIVPWYYFTYDNNQNVDSMWMNAVHTSEFTTCEDSDRIATAKYYAPDSLGVSQLNQEYYIDYGDNGLPYFSHVINNNNGENIQRYYYWNATNDTAWHTLGHEGPYIVIDSDMDEIDNGEVVREYYPYRFPMPNRSDIPNFVSPMLLSDGYKLTQKTFVDTNLIWEITIDSLIDDRVVRWTIHNYEYNNAVTWEAKWQFFAYDAQ